MDLFKLLRLIGIPEPLASKWVPLLQPVLQLYEINTSGRQAAFLAQILHESARLQFTTEIWGPTVAQRRYERAPSAPWLRGHKINSLAYDLGNTQPGDGAKFRGHGLIQVTGRFNHAQMRDWLRLRCPGLTVPDFEADPLRLAEPIWAAYSAGEYWAQHGLNALADACQFDAITRAINGGLNGQDDRLRLLRQLTAVLLDSEPEALEASDAPLPTPAPEMLTPSPALPPPQHPDPEPAPPAESTPWRLPAMSAFLPLAFEAVAQAVPSLIRLFGSSAVTERNARAAELVVQAAKDATGARNEQDLIETLKTADPGTLQAVNNAVQSIWYEITPDSSGILAARQAAAEAAAAGAKPWLNPALWVSGALLPLVYFTAWAVLTQPGFSAEVRSMVVASVITGVLTGLTGYWLGTSFSSARKTELQNGKPSPA
ncbi:glycoside hydrolase family 19 protein [Paucibacter sp. Y2R2-4]|uniref:glycoside hydrolase family 19 protein n=1 Tax=Paucibacter sp. Y2R2-4 TaxID=2893553 RepID=UPI0021E42971|nr:hypothetical protein [Paucibacter sp. Y2R2-4]MCV2349348.1 hypothetical protein [Paucibacter sp. Y2R2-4]